MIRLKNTVLFERVLEYSEYVLDGGLILDEENRTAIKTGCEAFEKGNGVLAIGNPSSGKSLLFDLIQKCINPNSINYFMKISALEVVSHFNNKNTGHLVFKKWQQQNVLFDDLGSEDLGIHFGDKVEVFEKFIQIRYDLWKNKGLKTHFTSNLDKDDLKKRYGIRCFPRLNEMCEFVIIGGSKNSKDRREYKNFKGFPPVIYETVKHESKIDYNAYKENRAIQLQKDAEEGEKGSGIGSRMRESQGYTNEKQEAVEAFKKQQGIK